MAAHQFYYAILPPNDYSPTLVFICPIKYFDHRNDMIRESMPILHLIPEYFVETLEGIYETDIAEYLVRNDLIKRGFVKSEKFSYYCANRFELSEG